VVVTTTVTMLAPLSDAITSSGASGAETTCPPVTVATQPKKLLKNNLDFAELDMCRS
jgi:hypothetical protein